jgi:putative inorganic carbon (hco3(-)) transporter
MTVLSKTARLKQRWGILVVTPVPISILVLLCMLPVTLRVTHVPQKTLYEVSWLLVGIGAFFLISTLCNSAANLHRLVILSILAGLFITIVIPACIDWQIRPPPALLIKVSQIIPHITGFSAHPNTLAVFLLTCLPFYLGLLLFGAKEMRPAVWAFTIIVVLLGLAFLLLSQSVGGWAGMAVALLLLVQLRWRRCGLLAILVTSVILTYLLIFAQFPAVKVFTSQELLEPLRLRLELWLRALFLIRDFPITGIGMGTYRETVDSLYPLFVYPYGDIPHPHSHNIYLQMGVDLGLPGLFAWLTILITAFIAAWQIYRIGRDRCDLWLMGLGAGLICCQAGLMVHGLVDNVAMAFWPVWGLAIGCRNLLFRKEVTLP